MSRAGLNISQAFDDVRLMKRLALTTVLLHEIECYDRLLITIHQTLSALCMAVRGEVVMSDTLEDIYNKMLKNIVPANWMVCF